MNCTISKNGIVLKGKIEDICNFLDYYKDKYVYVEELIDHLISMETSNFLN